MISASDANGPTEVTQLVAQLSADDASRRAQAAEQLAKRGDLVAGAATALVRAAGDASDQVRQWASAALEELGPPAIGQAASLTALLDHTHPDVAYWAATLLGRLETEARASVPKLAEVLLGNASAEVRARCAWALGKIGAAEGALEALQQASADADPRVARLARQAMAGFKDP